jgi:thioredoxin reductase
MTDCDVAIVGAGPYGLAAAAHLGQAGVEAHVLGDPMSFWREMPEGMVLRSNRTATSIAACTGPISMDAWEASGESGGPVGRRATLEQFLAYGDWVQRQVAPDVDRRRVLRLEPELGEFGLALDDGDRLRARRVVLACGIGDFVHRPSRCVGLPRELVSHVSEQRDLGVFAGKRVLVVGGGQSALESAALLHERGASAEVAVRADHVNWLHGGRYQRRLGKAAPLFYAPTDVGPMGISRLVATPGLFTSLPRAVQDPLAARAIRAAGAEWLRPRLRDVAITCGTEVLSATPTRSGRLQVELTGGDIRVVDHLLLGTGYRVDVARYPFLSPELRAGLDLDGGYPVLRAGMESSVPGLHILGAPAARSFGPTMRFVSGSWYSGRALAAAMSRVPGTRSDYQPAA